MTRVHIRDGFWADMPPAPLMPPRKVPMSDILTLREFTVSITEAQLKDVLKKVVEQSNPGFVVTKINIHTTAGYSDAREYQAPGVTKVDIELKKEASISFGRGS